MSGRMELGDALAWLDRHQNLERMLGNPAAATPDPARMRALMAVLGNPESAMPVIHVTGTNGKTSTARAAAQLLMAKGLSVGLYTSPHLERINERISADGDAVTDAALAEVFSDVAAVEDLAAGGSGRPSWFELLTAAALRWFADKPVDVAVVEVGLGGRWDATNVVSAAVAVVTNVGLDHVELLGPTRAHVAAEKAGIVTAGAPLVLGEADPSLRAAFEGEGPEPLLLAGRDWAVEANAVAVGGRLVDIRTPLGRYPELWLDLHGAHQADNFAAALVAVEAFFAAPVEADLVAEAAATVSSPGRLEIVGRQPLVVLDGAKNPEGARAAAAAVAEEFGETKSMILVVGMLSGKEPAEMIEALGGRRARLIVACPPPSPRALPAAELAAAAARFGVATEVADSVGEALDVALGHAGPEDLVLVAGSLYVVGAARSALGGTGRASR